MTAWQTLDVKVLQFTIARKIQARMQRNQSKKITVEFNEHWHLMWNIQSSFLHEMENKKQTRSLYI